MSVKYSTFLVLLFLVPTHILAQFSDNFMDGDFTQNPTWSGDDTKFVVNPSFVLQLDAPAVTDTAILTTASQAVNNASWAFYCRLDFAPSTSNFARIYLMSPTPNIKGGLNGYFVQIGGSTGTTDDVSLYRQNGFTITKIIDGTNGTVATNPELAVRTTRNTAGVWELEIDTGLTGTFVSQGTITDNTFTSASYFGVFCKYTSTRSDKFFFDDFVVTGTPYTDTTPPVVDSVVVTMPNALAVHFNEKITVVSAQNTANYNVNNGIGNPSSAVIDLSDSTLVNLTFPTNFISGTTYTLAVSNIEDLFGNIMNTQNIAFVAGGATGIQYGDVVINEIMADPSPPVGLPNAEFVELYNASLQAINLDGWKYSDASVTTLLPPVTLNTNSYLILCAQADTALFSGFGQVIGLSPWPSLNNTGDFLGLRSDVGNLIDSVAYTDNWYDDANKENGGWSLERINPLTNCSSSANWRASNHATGGTPGFQNSIFDTLINPVAPVAISATIPNVNTIVLEFDKPLDTAAINVSNFQSNLLMFSSAVPQSFTTVVLSVISPMANDKIYIINFTGLQSCDGIAVADSSIRTAIGISPGISALSINEIYANPSPLNVFLPEAEFVEIRNTTDRPVRMNGMELADKSTATPLPDMVIFPGEYLILCPEIAAPDYAAFGPAIGLNPWPSLNNSGDIIELIDSFGDPVSTVIYSDAWYGDDEKKKGGWSLEQINFHQFCTGAENWRASEDTKGATPGIKNSLEDTSFIIFPKITSIVVLSDTAIQVHFSYFMHPDNFETSNFVFSGNAGIDTILFDPFEGNQCIVILKEALIRGSTYTLTNVYPIICNGGIFSNPIDFTFTYPGLNDLIINEILFDPRGSGSDFVELYNMSSSPIDLNQWQFAYLNNAGDTAYKPISATSRIIYPGSFVALTENAANIIFEYPNSIDSNLFEMDLPTFPNTSGMVTLVDPSFYTIDEFRYDASMHSPVLSSTEGVSLERVSYTRPTNEPTNWHSAASTAGFATPGKVNSQWSENPQPGGNVSINPEIFSPDNDGYNDFVTINYQFDKAGYTGTITIYDANGGFVYTLLNNQSLSTSGTISWDGRNDRGEIVESGMYIILVRVFDLDGKQQVFKNVVVAATK